eukprot:TRINITY_DN36_c0_g1_i1.p1 TRINITY_DN36_c0_g1~~TRINITY_DN36_c0_g1_i1.p1  ORF type:complete len:111 (+),score=39.39 TRINITY_DN36_c0_g1_i1:316-648(+)
MSGQAGVKTLLDAEQKAQEIVNKARRDKVALLKQARDEADKEIAEYRQKRQKEYDEYAKTHVTGTDTYAKQLAVQTKESISKLEKDIVVHKDKVIQLLVKSVTEVYTEVN